MEKNLKIKQNKLFERDKIKILENSILINQEILVIADLHIGYEEKIASSGLLRMQMTDIFERVDRIIERIEKEKIKLKKIIILGDLKHDFGKISESEWRDTIKLLGYLEKKCDEVILTQGNHDKVIGPIANKTNINVVDYWIEFIKKKKIGFLHGDEWFKGVGDCDILIVGHSHPAITLEDEYKQEKYKCFLRGKWDKRVIYIIPSFSEISYGHDMKKFEETNHKGFSIIPNEKMKKFELFIYNKKEDKIYDFGKLDKI